MFARYKILCATARRSHSSPWSPCFQQLAECRAESERKSLRHYAGTLLRAHRAAKDAERAKAIVNSGRAFQRSKKLHQIETLRLKDGSFSADREQWQGPLRAEYGRKWGTSKYQQREYIVSLLERSEAMQFEIPWETIARAVDCIRKCNNRDSTGACALIIRAFIFGHPTAAQRLFTQMFVSADFMKSFTIEGALFGKESSHTPPDKTPELCSRCLPYWLVPTPSWLAYFTT